MRSYLNIHLHRSKNDGEQGTLISSHFIYITLHIYLQRLFSIPLYIRGMLFFVKRDRPS